MKIQLKREEIRKEYFSTAGMLVINMLGIIGMLVIYFSGILQCRDLNMIYDCLSRGGLIIIFAAFFVSIFLYCWTMFFLNICVRPKKEILYLKKDEDDEFFFVNKKGKIIFYNDDNENTLEENCYYYVLKTRDCVYEVIEKTYDNWNCKDKE